MLALGGVGEELARPRQLLRREGKMLLGDDQRVDHAKRRGRPEAVLDQACVHLANVEALAVLGHYNVRFVQKLPDLLQQRLIVANFGLSAASGVRINDRFLTEPFRGEGQDRPIGLYEIDPDVLFPEAPHVRLDGAGLYVDREDARARHSSVSSSGAAGSSFKVGGAGCCGPVRASSCLMASACVGAQM